MNDFLNQLFQEHQQSGKCLSPDAVADWFTKMFSFIYPERASSNFKTQPEFNAAFDELKNQLSDILCTCHNENSDETVEVFFSQLPALKSKLDKDLEATFLGDPAAKTKQLIVRSYPGFFAITAYRIANSLHLLNNQLLPRALTEFAHEKTGIDIHPGATIGEYFCIDHGTGMVIGETTEIGNHVKLYQGVTLGALSVDKEDASTKRHPTIEDEVVIYAGATILGGETTIGKSSVIGGNVWLTRSVPPNSKVYYKASMSDESGEIDRIIIKS